MKSTTRFPISLRRIVYVDPKPPKGALKRKVSQIKQQSAITSKRYEIGCQLLLTRRSFTVHADPLATVFLRHLDLISVLPLSLQTLERLNIRQYRRVSFVAPLKAVIIGESVRQKKRDPVYIF